MAYTTDADLLQQVRNALHAIVVARAQSYTINMGASGSRTVTKLNIEELRKWEADLEAKIEAAAGKGRFGVAVFRPTT